MSNVRLNGRINFQEREIKEVYDEGDWMIIRYISFEGFIRMHFHISLLVQFITETAHLYFIMSTGCSSPEIMALPVRELNNNALHVTPVRKTLVHLNSASYTLM